MNKKAFMKTIEAMLAVILTGVFVLYLIPQFTGTEVSEQSMVILNNLEKTPNFRNFVISTTGCFNSSNVTVREFITSYLPEEYSYLLCISGIPDNLPDEKVFLDTAFFSGNISFYSPRTVRLYYWIE